SPSLPGNTDSIRAHTSSLSNVRIILTCSRKRQDVNTFHRLVITHISNRNSVNFIMFRITKSAMKRTEQEDES
ncbi:hypothetical protein, partial [Burkholderia ubonensis]|uniref:hypothetical protein n=1 Tax=Burkholderia ubonensis TaxID=101571 RepID=UPI001E62C247